MAGGAHATPVCRASCTVGYAGCRRSLFYHHSYMYYQKTIHVGKAPIRPCYDRAFSSRGDPVIKNIGAFGNILILKIFTKSNIQGAIRWIALPKFQITSTKFQINSKFQIPMTETKTNILTIYTINPCFIQNNFISSTARLSSISTPHSCASLRNGEPQLARGREKPGGNECLSRRAKVFSAAVLIFRGEIPCMRMSISKSTRSLTREFGVCLGRV